MSSLLPVAILAGGMGTRLGRITQTIPKALVDVAGEPFIRHQLRLLRRNGATRVVICAGYLGELIEKTLQAMPEPGLHVEVAYDGERLLGTAGALRAAAPRLGDAFFVLYGDSYLSCAFDRVQASFERSGKLALMTVFRNDGQFDRSNVEYAGGRIIAYRKDSSSPHMRHIDYGLGILTSAALERVPAAQAFDLAALYADLLRRDQLAAFEVTDRFYEIGSVQGLQETRTYLAAVSARS